MSKKKALLTMYAMAAIASVTATQPYSYGVEQKESEEDRKKRLLKSKCDSEEELNRLKGLKEFVYGENKLWALNQKSADKKAKSRGWI